MDDRRREAERKLGEASRALGQQVTRAGSGVPWDFQVATVTATSPLTVEYADGVPLVGFAHLAGYTPTIGDTVLVLVRAPVATIIDRFA